MENEGIRKLFSMSKRGRQFTVNKGSGRGILTVLPSLNKSYSLPSQRVTPGWRVCKNTKGPSQVKVG